MELLLVGRGGPIAAVRLVIGSLRLSAWDNRVGGYVRDGAAGRPRRPALGRSARSTWRARGWIKTSRATITAHLRLRTTRALAGHRYRIQVQADDLDGDHQGERIAGGSIRVERAGSLARGTGPNPEQETCIANAPEPRSLSRR